MSRVSTTMWLAGALALAWLALPALPDATACTKSRFGGQMSSCHGEIGWTYDRGAGVFTRGGKPSSVTSGGVRYYYEYGVRCEQGVNCLAALSCGPGGYRYNVAVYLVLVDGTRAADPIRYDTVCVYPEATVPLASVTAAAHEELRKRLAAPSIISAPPGKTLVNIITIYYTPVGEPQTLTVSLPVPGALTATPTYAWDFGDGQAATGAGLAYQSPDDPNRLPGKYLGPVWRTAGIKHVTLTATWTVDFRLGSETVPLAPIVFTATEDKTVATARAVLVNQ